MAARRLLIIMFLLLAISTLAAALVPPPEQRGETGRSTPSRSTATAATEGAGRGSLVAARVAAGGKPDRIRVSAGDQLSLVVSSPYPSEVYVPSFGLTGFAEPGAPARFDFLTERPGRFDVVTRGEGPVATIVVRRAELNPEARPAARRP